jgi:hypothetical protein
MIQTCKLRGYRVSNLFWLSEEQMGLAAQESDNSTISIDATFLKAHHTASSLWVKKGSVDAF